MYSQIEKTPFQMQQNMVLKQIDTNYCRFWQLQALACLYAHNKKWWNLVLPDACFQSWEAFFPTTGYFDNDNNS